jgi:hypothetical protein
MRDNRTECALSSFCSDVGLWERDERDERKTEIQIALNCLAGIIYLFLGTISIPTNSRRHFGIFGLDPGAKICELG